MPIRTELEAKTKSRTTERKIKRLQAWSPEAKAAYVENSRKLEFEKNEINEMLNEFAEKVQTAVIHKKVRIKDCTEKRAKSWWDEACKIEKKKLLKILRLAKKGKAGIDDIKRARKNYKTVYMKKYHNFTLNLAETPRNPQIFNLPRTV